MQRPPPACQAQQVPPRLIYDLALPGVEDALGALGRCEGYPAQELTPQRCREYDALVIRSVTRIDATFAQAVRDSRLRIVATATSGEDHVDVHALAQAGIGFASAEGCNADAVAQWVMWALARLATQRSHEIIRRVGIVGFGHTGRRVARCLQVLGVPVVACDPPLRAALQEGSARAALHGPSTPHLDALPAEVMWASLDELIGQCSAVSLHVPLCRVGPYPTLGLIGAEQLRSSVMAWCNASRGTVFSEAALLRVHDDPSLPAPVAALDVWTGEPAVEARWLDRPACIPIATPHIAGHTQEAKSRALTLLHDPIANALGSGHRQRSGTPSTQSAAESSLGGPASPQLARIVSVERDAGQAAPSSDAASRPTPSSAPPQLAAPTPSELARIHGAIWRMLAEDPVLDALEDALRASVAKRQVAATFHALRSTLPSRREWSAIPIEVDVSQLAAPRAEIVDAQVRRLVRELGFHCAGNDRPEITDPE